jgi:hypothetical protein
MLADVSCRVKPAYNSILKDLDVPALRISVPLTQALLDKHIAQWVHTHCTYNTNHKLQIHATYIHHTATEHYTFLLFLYPFHPVCVSLFLRFFRKQCVEVFCTHSIKILAQLFLVCERLILRHFQQTA